MTIKITYDLDDEKQSQMIEDYYFFRYYLKSLLFDWNHIKLNYGIGDEERRINIINIIMSSLNKVEYERFKNIYKMLIDYEYFGEYNDEYDNITDHEILEESLFLSNDMITRYKCFLNSKFNKPKFFKYHFN